PAQIVTGVRRSNCQCQQADQNWDYQHTLNEDAAHRAQRLMAERSSEGVQMSEGQKEAREFPGAFTASTESLEDFIFAGAANS
ncbi:hypothetical protein PAXRUDRAFT_110540, partial [Paxillus rubicundulus Ve08.2h10]